MGILGLTAGVKQWRHEADHIPPSGSEIKNIFMVWYLVK
jgi:hypothetical protein